MMRSYTIKSWVLCVIAEVALFAFIYYLQFVFKIFYGTWLNALILWVLINGSIMFAPIVAKYLKKAETVEVATKSNNHKEQ